MDIGHFQFITSLLQFASALHAGFAVSEGFRNLPMKKFESEADNWLKLMDAEVKNTSREESKQTATAAEVRAREFIHNARDKGAILTGEKVKKSIYWAICTFAYSAVLSLVPLPLMNVSEGWINALFFISWCVAMCSVIMLALTYKDLLQFWKQKQQETREAAKLQTGKDVGARLPA